MARRSTQPDERRKRWIRWLPLAALILAGVYLLSIHPATSFVGGIVYLLAGWAIPSALNLVLAVWVALLPRMRGLLRIPLGVLVSFVIGMNTLLPAVLLPSAPPPVEMVVIRPVPAVPGLAVDARLIPVDPRNPYNMAIEPSPLGLDIGGDEGCMCMYWVAHNRAWRDQVQAVINDRHFRDGDGAHLFSSQFPDSAPYNKIVHFSVGFAQLGARHDLIDMTVDVYQGFDKVASYRQHDLPVETGLLGRGYALLNGRFLQNSWGMLIHRNFWTLLLHDRLQGGRPAAPFKDFLAKAMPNVPWHDPAGDTPMATAGGKAYPQPASLLPPVPASPGVKTLVVSPEPGAGVDWVLVSTNDNEGALGYNCDVAALPDGTGHFVARIDMDHPSGPTGGCDWHPERVEVRLFSNGFYVGDDLLPEETVRDNGVYRSFCESQRKVFPAASGLRLPPLCTPNDIGTWGTAHEAEIRSNPEWRVIDLMVKVGGNRPYGGPL